MSTAICPAEYPGCCQAVCDITGCVVTCFTNARPVPTLGQYGALALVLLVIGIGLAALWRHASQQDAHRKQHGPQPRYPHADQDSATARPGITPIDNICPRHGWPCDSIAKRCSGCGEEQQP